MSRNLYDMPVAFHSRQLRDREKNYSASELEGLAVIEAIRHFEIYLFGSEFTVVTDHKAITHLFSSTVLNAKLWRWALYLLSHSGTCLVGLMWWPTASLDRHGYPLRLQVSCQTRSQSHKLFHFWTDQGLKKTKIPLLVLQTSLYFNWEEMWEYSHQARTLPHYQETYRQTAIHIWMDNRLEQKAAAELLMSFNNIVLVRCRFTGSLLFPYMHICKVLGHRYLSLALTQLVPVTIILVK